ncbi:MAG TPA: twin-arginine translocation signal domain-containing protein [Candidatus Binatia bacterium]
MEEQARSTRRDFLKDLGTSAAGTAIISAGLLNPHQVEGAQSAGAARALVPTSRSITQEHLDNVRKHMAKFLEELKSAGVVQVNLRLNESQTEQKLPVFIDWVGTADTHSVLARQGFPQHNAKSRSHRFGDSIRSVVYETAVGDPPKIIDRDWCEPGVLKEKTAQSQLLAQRAGAMYQMFIGIVAEQDGRRRCVGLLTAGFPKKLDPSKKKQVEDKMKEWAGWTSTRKDLVNYLAGALTLGGPTVKL